MSKSSPNRHRLREIFGKAALHVQEQFESELGAVEHPGEKGRARERVLMEYLRKFIPDRFGIDSGFVVDSNGNISKQIDVVVYDQVLTPVLELPGELKYFPCEGVVAVGEVKSSINSRENLSDALEKLESVKRLDRFTGDKNIAVAAYGLHGHINVMKDQKGHLEIPYRIFSFIFTSESLSKATLLQELDNYCSERPKRYWPNIFVDFNKYVISYLCLLDKGKTGLNAFPDQAVGFYVTSPKESDRTTLLFTMILANFLTIVRTVRPLLLDYLGVKQSNVEQVPFGVWMSKRMKRGEW